MKTTALYYGAVGGLLVLAAATAHQGIAAESKSAGVSPEKTYTGTVVSIDPKEAQLKLKGMCRAREFNLGDKCAYVFLNMKAGGAGSIQPGQRLTVRYQNAGGVLIADRVEQTPWRYEGTVKSVDPAAQKIVVHSRAQDRTFA